ncbi:hypothetical protein Ahy_A06g029670 isoform A [Arachis hypogaea]|uniref:Replication factor A C-terminal domain-containing protein n=1 Tax=Arachis hypogaea TaxID=3818 RepID=A0A445CTU0_ARAHY|nr:hypothetical protein Ahy_A06g029670 isoform A [Arachis hypogaea]
MGERCVFLEEISTKRVDWIIKVYVVRMWYGPPQPNSSEASALEIVLHDSKNLFKLIYHYCYFIVTRAARYTERFQNQWYDCSNLFCQRDIYISNMWMKYISLQYRITLLQRSMVLHIPQPLGVLRQSCKKKGLIRIFFYNDLVQTQTSFCILDVLAEVIEKEDSKDLVTKQGQKSKQLGLKNSISCILFGSLVDLIQPYLDRKISIPSSFDTSNLHINSNIKEAKLFKKRISHLSSSSYRSAIDELRKAICKVEIIDNVLNASDVRFKWILYTIVDFDVRRNDWFFIACKFKCDHCHKKAVRVDLRYKLQAYIFDATGSMSVVLWDTEASQILGLSATKVKESYSEDDSGNSYPEVLKADSL